MNDTIKKFSPTKDDQNWYIDNDTEEITLGPQKTKITVFVINLVKTFFEFADDLEINYFLEEIKELCGQIEQDSINELNQESNYEHIAGTNFPLNLRKNQKTSS